MKTPAKWLPPYPRKLSAKRLLPLSLVIAFLLILLQVRPVSASESKQDVVGGYAKRVALSRVHKITAIGVETDDQGTKVHIVANGKLTRYDAFHLSDPARLVVDLFGVQSAVGKETLLFSNPLVKGVRLGTSYKDQVRVVLDLIPSGVPPYQIVPKNDGLLVFVEQVSDIPATPLPSGATRQVGVTSASPELARKPLTTVPPGEVMLHVSSYKEKANAEDEVQSLGKYGYKTFIAEEEVSGERWFRVYIGTFKDEQEARKVGSELKTKGLISYFKPTKVDQSVTVAKKAEPRTAPLARAPKEVLETKTEPTRKQDDLVKKQRIAIAEPEREEIQKPSSRTVEDEKKEIMTRVPEKGKEAKIGEIREEKTISKVKSDKKEAPKPSSREERMEDTGKIKEESIRSGKDSKSRFSISVKSGIFFTDKSGDFEITKRGTSNNDTWNISGGTALDVAVVPSFRFNRRLSLDAGFEGILAGNINLTFLTLGPKIVFGSSNRFFPYLNAGAVYGTLDWDGPPGNFKDSIGWQAGFGTDLFDSQLKVGLHFLYRNIQFDYEAPSGQQVTANQGSIDFTGYSISALLRYYF